ncbi:hypothetical protein H6P81_009618 [Aristolochia fimbriata]|uniref:Uncharacterized protein n=1 Tax=Aristolochia fimbriata TaxID=158543 RepID=A0AAV7ELJ0_ARIFI|nr:hypothetical protein H6P81_009618 [Aristolochia fimbriata]
MAVVLSSPSPTHVEKDDAVSFPCSAHTSPTSEERFWSNFSDRIEVILENRKRKGLGISDVSEGERDKRFKEDTMLLLRGFDSVASSLSHLTHNIDDALQGARDLAKPSLTELFNREPVKVEKEKEIEEVENQCGIDESSHKIEGKDKQIAGGIEKAEKLKKATNLAVSMATKAATLAREVKSIKSNLSFLQERCVLLEEENKRLREGFAKGLRPEEDDLVRLQLEALLAEKSRLANENANLTRENQCLHQLVEYHQLTTQDLSESYEQVRGLCLDFSSPSFDRVRKHDGDDDEEGLHTPPDSVNFEFPVIEPSHEDQ